MAKKRPRARLIYNPTSGKEAMRNVLADVLDILEQGGLETSCHMTKNIAGDATRAAADAAKEGFDYVIAAGGDGTVSEVVNGLASASRRPVLGIIPAGTSNDLARSLNIPRDIKAACRQIVKFQTVPLDLGEADGKYFVNIAGCGRLTEITYEVPSKLKTMLGQLAYYVKGLEKLPMLRPIHIEVEARDFAYSGKVMLCLIANSNTVGGFEKLAPKARLDDGLLDVIIIKQVSLPHLIRLATAALRGEHIASDRVIYLQTDCLRVHSGDHVDLNFDGEYGGPLPRTFKACKHHLQVLI
jgi:diacylglycerol kinase (ATP)